jgi:hypothetical protein
MVIVGLANASRSPLDWPPEAGEQVMAPRHVQRQEKVGGRRAKTFPNSILDCPRVTDQHNAQVPYD